MSTQVQNLSQNRFHQAIAGAQMLFVAFGALVLVPLITGLDPNVAFFTAGAGTLVFQVVTKRKVPIFLASSFAFIAPICYGIKQWGIPATMGGLIAAGCFYVLLSALVKLKGADILHKVLPPVVVGPVIIVIGLNLAPVAVSMALGKDASGVSQFPLDVTLIVSLSSLITTLLVAIMGKGLLKLIPILAGISVGYSLSLFYGIVDFTPVIQAPWFAIPNFVAPAFNAEAILYMIPVAIAPAIEHVGDILAISSVTNKDFFKDPGLHRTMLGDGLATMTAGFLGGPPNTTYSEVTGAVTLTKAFNPVIMTWAAGCAVVVSFAAKVGAVLQTIPILVMGGIMTLLFGSIAVVGMNSLIRNKVDLNDPRNMCIVSVVLVFGIGGMVIGTEDYTLQGIALCGVIAILLNLLLPKSQVEEK